MVEHDDTAAGNQITELAPAEMAGSNTLSRLNAAQRTQLDNLVETFAIAGMQLTGVERDAAARLMLGEISFEEYLAETEPRPDASPSDSAANA